MTHRRDEIQRFCRNFLQGNNQRLHELNGNYEFSQTDIQQLFTKEAFDKYFVVCVIYVYIVFFCLRLSISYK